MCQIDKEESSVTVMWSFAWNDNCLNGLSLRNQSFITILHQSSKVTEVSPSRIWQDLAASYGERPHAWVEATVNVSFTKHYVFNPFHV